MQWIPAHPVSSLCVQIVDLNARKSYANDCYRGSRGLTGKRNGVRSAVRVEGSLDHDRLLALTRGGAGLDNYSGHGVYRTVENACHSSPSVDGVDVSCARDGIVVGGRGKAELSDGGEDVSAWDGNWVAAGTK